MTMTFHEWDTTSNVAEMLETIRGRVSDRKLLLFTIDCLRSDETRLPGARVFIKLLEARRDRVEKPKPPTSLLASVFTGISNFIENPASLITGIMGGLDDDAWGIADGMARFIRQYEMTPTDLEPPVSPPTDSPLQADILREIVGNPFCELDFDPRWRTETAIGLATTIEAENAWDRMPILADAIQDAGCEQSWILDHCRNPAQVHRRGCWVIDEILARDGVNDTPCTEG